MPRIIIFIIAILISAPAVACKCYKSPKNIGSAVKASYKSSDLVLIGTVESVTPIKIPMSFTPDGKLFGVDGQITEFFVIQSWKGINENKIYTSGINVPGTCGIAFKVGEQYLLYASGPNKEGHYTTNSCSRTKQIDAAKEEIEILNKMPNKSLKRAAFNGAALQLSAVSERYALHSALSSALGVT